MFELQFMMLHLAMRQFNDWSAPANGSAIGARQTGGRRWVSRHSAKRKSHVKRETKPDDAPRQVTPAPPARLVAISHAREDKAHAA
jgi:hypothetical protein